jgi:hypothetical protein
MRRYMQRRVEYGMYEDDGGVAGVEFIGRGGYGRRYRTPPMIRAPRVEIRQRSRYN